MTTETTLEQAVQKVVDYAERWYVERGYMYSGAISDGGHAGYDLVQTGLDRDTYQAAVDSLVAAGVLQLRGSIDTTYELTAARRRDLILVHNLHEGWEQGDGRAFYPHDPSSGEIPRVFQEAAASS